MLKEGGGRGFLRIIIGLKVSNPLVNGFWVPRKERDRVWPFMKYEKLYEFCFSCGKLRYLWKSCDNELGMSPVVPMMQLFGAHIRVGLILKIEVIGELLNLEIVFLINFKINLKFY